MSESLSLAERFERWPRALNATEVSEILNIDKVTVYKLAKRGVFPSFRIGGCVRFDGRSVAKWIRARESGAVR
jgi:excisionase family DNA binding protein